MGLQGLADLFLVPGVLQHHVHVVPQILHQSPLLHLRRAQRVAGKGPVHLIEDYVAAVLVPAVGHGLPDLITGEGQDGGEQLGHGI